MPDDAEERRQVAIDRATRAVAKALADLVEAASKPSPEHIPLATGTMTPSPDDVLTIEQVADITGLAKQTLRNMRSKGEGPRTWLLRGRVRCYRSDLDAWMRERSRL